MSSAPVQLELTRKQLWEGCIFASIAHAIMVAHYPELSHEHSWDGFHYNIQDTAGARGTVTFHPDHCVAAFCDIHSSRVETVHHALEYFSGAAGQVLRIAEEETIQYLLDEVDGEDKPLITCSFWEEDTKFYSLDSLDILQENGGFLLEYQMMDVTLVKSAWQEYYEMSSTQLDLLELIYQRKVKNPAEEIILSKHEIAMIGTKDKEGLYESRVSFEEIGIKWR